LGTREVQASESPGQLGLLGARGTRGQLEPWEWLGPLALWETWVQLGLQGPLGRVGDHQGPRDPQGQRGHLGDRQGLQERQDLVAELA
jgi:hypothetical protein